MALHRDLTPEDIHVIHAWSVADETARLALTPAASDVGRVAFQLDTRSLWVCVNHSPVSWRRLDQEQSGIPEVILTAPGGSAWRVTVSDTGSLITTEI